MDDTATTETIPKTKSLLKQIKIKIELAGLNVRAEKLRFKVIVNYLIHLPLNLSSLA